MTYTVSLPKSDAALDTAGNKASREYFRFFGDLARVNVDNAELPARVDALDVRVRALEERPAGALGRLVGPQSVRVDGLLSNGIAVVHLAGDVDQPAALSFYGALASGGRGWQNFAGDNFAARDNGDDTLSLDLADLADSGTGAALVKLTRDAKGRISGTSSATTTDLTEGSNLYFTDARAQAAVVVSGITDGDTTHSPSGDAVHDALALKINASEKSAANGVATLDAAGKLDPGQLPALAITETFVVNTQAAMLALNCQQGDVAVRTDLSKSLILTAEPPSTLSNWQELLTPTGGVASFNGRTGSVTPASGDYTPAQVGAEPAITPGTTAQYRRGDKSWQTLNKAAVGLGSVDNTSDADKPVSTAQAAAFAGKADKSFVDSGMYTPDAFAGSSVSSASGNRCRWIRIGNYVFVAGRVDFTTSAGGGATANVDISPPVASAFSLITQMAGAGTAVVGGARSSASMQSQVATGRLGLFFNSPTAATGAIFFSIGYDII